MTKKGARLIFPGSQATTIRKHAYRARWDDATDRHRVKPVCDVTLDLP